MMELYRVQTKPQSTNSLDSDEAATDMLVEQECSRRPSHGPQLRKKKRSASSKRICPLRGPRRWRVAYGSILKRVSKCPTDAPAFVMNAAE